MAIAPPKRVLTIFDLLISSAVGPQLSNAAASEKQRAVKLRPPFSPNQVPHSYQQRPKDKESNPVQHTLVKHPKEKSIHPLATPFTFPSIEIYTTVQEH